MWPGFQIASRISSWDFPHETFFFPWYKCCGWKIPSVQGEKKVSCGKFPRRDPTGNLKSWSHIYSNSYILLNFHTNESFTIQELPWLLPELPRSISPNTPRFILQAPLNQPPFVLWFSLSRRIWELYYTSQILQKFEPRYLKIRTSESMTVLWD